MRLKNHTKVSRKTGRMYLGRRVGELADLLVIGLSPVVARVSQAAEDELLAGVRFTGDLVRLRCPTADDETDSTAANPTAPPEKEHAHDHQ